MHTSNNTVLITGGSSGIGFELAKQLLELGNTVIVTGREKSRLEEAKKKLPRVHTIQSDASDPEAISRLSDQATQEFPNLNVLINNAGAMRKINLQSRSDNLSDITREIEINLKGPIWMVQHFLTHLKSQPSAAIVNLSSGLAFAPMSIAPVYCATKAGIHSYTQSLRIQLKKTNVRVFELAPPGTETPLFYGDFTAEDIGGVKPMNVETLVQHAIKGIRNDTFEIRPGLSNVLELMSRVAPRFIVKQLGKSADTMIAKETGSGTS
jgi:uncharacterized oxidoreductase